MQQRRPLMLPKTNFIQDDSEEEEDEDELDLEVGEFDDVTADADLDALREKRRRRLELQSIEDAQYEGEWGYALIKALRGKTVGRRIRRKLFKYGLFQLICGGALLVIAIEETRNYQTNEYVNNAKYGGSLEDLTWCVSFPSFFIGIVTMLAVKNWASLVTNRALLSSLLRIYTFASLLIFVLTLWTTCALFLTFKKVKNWSVDVTTQSLLPYYICTTIFITPYLLFSFLYTLDVSYLTTELEKGGNIAELDPPDDVRDLSDVTLFQSCVFVCAMPCIIGIQCCDLLASIRRAYNRFYREESLCQLPSLSSSCWLKSRTVSAEVAKEQAKEQKKKKKTVWHRLFKTCMRCFNCGRSHHTVKPSTDLKTKEVVKALPLRALEKDKEQEERELREKVMLEQEAERQRIAQLEAEANAEFIRKQEEALQEAARKIQEQKLREEQEEAERKKVEEAANRWEAVLTVAQFKSLWSTFPTNGSFQCNLKAMPTLNAVVEHLKKQGFHIVFAVSPNANNIEIGICNVRPLGQPSWFMARFLATNNSFSAVMKSDNAEIVPQLVKKFALAKVLKIETPGK